MVNYLSTPNSKYQEDISQGLAGTILIAQPCQVWQITVIVDTADAATVNFANNSAGYTAATRNFKTTVSGPNTINIEFPHGLVCASGLSAIANTGSVDIFISYD